MRQMRKKKPGDARLFLSAETKAENLMSSDRSNQRLNILAMLLRMFGHPLFLRC